jgi:hypothetical protein
MLRKTLRSGLTALLLVVSSLSVAATPDVFVGAIEHARLVGALPLDSGVFHVQGLALDGPFIWITSVDLAGKRGYIHQFDRASGRLIRRLELTDGARYHPGGISIGANADRSRSIWVPVAELRPDSTAVLVEIDADTFAVKRRIAVADHLGCVAVSGHRLVAGNWDSHLLYEFDLAGKQRELRPVRVVPNPSATHFQDMKFVGNQLVAGGNRNWWNGTVDWIDWPTLKLMRSVRAGAAGPIRAYTGEGMAIEGRDLYLAPEDGPGHVFHFRLDA